MPPNSVTWIRSRHTADASKAGMPPVLRARRNRPVRSKVQAWYGHTMLRRTPEPDSSSCARCLHTL
ncbi:hypothetical protein [Nonomuraea rubra]|uniref:hypothetical protein n=1 Tax=Nonomuraea rubra TaxID=46180 RepID=UPI0031EC6F28